MQEDSIIQKTLFAIDNENNEQKDVTKIPEDLSWEDLKKESQKRPRPVSYTHLTLPTILLV